MITKIKKCSVDAWYNVASRKLKNLLSLRIMTQKEYDVSNKKLAWEYWERLERVDCGEN